MGAAVPLVVLKELFDASSAHSVPVLFVIFDLE